MGKREIQRAARRAGVDVEATWGEWVNAFSGEREWMVTVSRAGREIETFPAFSSDEAVEYIETTDWSAAVAREYAALSGPATSTDKQR